MALALRGSSRQSFSHAQKALESSLSGSSAIDAANISQDFFGIAVTLDSSLALRRSLSDPSREPQEKIHLVQSLFSSKFKSKNSENVIAVLVSQRWSTPRDLADVAEWLAVSAQAFAAEQAGNLERLEEELFRFSRVISSNPDLRTFLASSTADLEGKTGLIHSLLEGKVAPQTLELILQVALHPRGRNIEAGLSEFAQAASDRRNQVIAHVRTAQELSSTQVDTLKKSLAEQVGRNVRLNVEVDPTILGGVSIRFADELIDGSLASRLAQAGRELTV
jgi:F-type H+-transporting ATPase subunit delta